MTAPRPAEEVMRLARMGAAHPTRLSFLRVLLRRVQAEGWQFDRPLWQIDAKGVGRAIYRAQGPERSYCLVAFAHDLPDDMRSDRVIATAWDATFALTDGLPDAALLEELAANVPLQEAGRVGPQVLTLSRANRSVRLFDHVVDCLSRGNQPDPARLAEVGYLMRTTAVYGSGKFGAADRQHIAARPELTTPFQAEMLTVWLIRQFTVDIAEHLARTRGGPRAVCLDPALRQRLGVGNATGLGMAPFLIRHPRLLNNWMAAREAALARVRGLSDARPEAIAALRAALQEVRATARDWPRHHPLQSARLTGLTQDLTRLSRHLRNFPGRRPLPWDRLWRWGAQRLGLEGQEALAALMLEPHGDLIDDLAPGMSADEAAAFRIDGAMPLAEMATRLGRRYGWARAYDFAEAGENARFWYVSQEKLEPRIGERARDEGAAREQPLDIARQVQALHRAMAAADPALPLAHLLRDRPDLRMIARRVQGAADLPYGEVQDNLLAADVLPIDLMRCKLAFFGASQFDPKSDKWVRISLFRGAPFPLSQPPGEAGAAVAAPPRQAAPVRLSRGEIEALTLKAARGAGRSWGIAEEAAMALGQFCGWGLDAAPALVALLQQTAGAAEAGLSPLVGAAGWRALADGPLCPILTGAMLSDFAALPEGVIPLGHLRLPLLHQPGLLLPFLAAIARDRGLGITLTAGGLDLYLPPGAPPEGPAEALLRCPVAEAEIRLSAPGAASRPVTAPPPRPAIRTADLAALEALALQTAVPPSDRSRRDAGAEGGDND